MSRHSKYRKFAKAAWRHHSRRLRRDQRGNRVGPELRKAWAGEWRSGRPPVSGGDEGNTP